MKPVCRYEVAAVYTDNDGWHKVIADFNENHDTMREAFIMIGNLADDRQGHETLSWTLREIYVDESSAIIQTGEISDTGTKVSSNGLIGQKTGQEYYL